MHRVRRFLAQLTFPLRHPVRWIERQRLYWKARQTAGRTLRKLLPSRLRRALRALLTTFRDQTEVAPIDLKASIKRTDRPFDTLRILPRIDPDQVETALAHSSAATPARPPDVICFSIIDWQARYQRPQQMMSQYAAHGHRVFYIDLVRFRSPYDTRKVSVHEIKPNIYSISLTAVSVPRIYSEPIDGRTLDLLLESISDLRRFYGVSNAICYIMIASWAPLALELRRRWGWNVIYDCMDEWEGFPLIKRPVIEMEEQLARECDLLVVTAARLHQKWHRRTGPMVLARNAVDFEFFSERCVPNSLLGDVKRPIIGYYGAIAEWFDLDLMAEVVTARPEYSFVIIGGVYDVDVSTLRACPNVKFLGHRPYETMPEYLFHFDVCLIPFKINQITESTDPVKLYEYLSAGKPVVSVNLPEVEIYREHIYLANNALEFATQLDRALDENDPQLIESRKQLAGRNTWGMRYREISTSLAAATTRVSIVIVTFNNLALSKLCLESVLRNTDHPNYEVIIVDNASQDTTPAWLEDLSRKHEHVRVILNQSNLGFAKANNQGLELATGDTLVLLNNDTMVPTGWLARLLAPLRDERIGLVGPMTNAVGNEAKVSAPYRSIEEMETFAHERNWEHDGEIADIHVLAMYCVAMRRRTYEEVGPLDEQFGIGMFEDDDYSMRIRARGYRVVCAMDAFVHHVGQAAFAKLIESGEYDRLFEANRKLYETKWNVTWTPHRNTNLNPAS